MKTKIFVIPVLIILLASSISLAHIESNGAQELFLIHHFSIPLVMDNENSVSIFIPEASSCDYTPGEPLLPVHKEILSFPLGTHITKIVGFPGIVHTLSLTKQVQKAPDPFLTTPDPSSSPHGTTVPAAASSQAYRPQQHNS